MVVIGLTGGIGSGKSTVSAMLAELGAIVIDADAIVHELQRPGAPMLAVLAERFGTEIVSADGSLDRARLAGVAFHDDDALRDLNAIVHPSVRAEMVRRRREHAATDHVVVLDIPLVTDPFRDGLQALIVVDVPIDVAVARLVGQRAMSESDVRARVAKQIPREQRLALADRVIDNSGDREALRRQVADVWAWLASFDLLDSTDNAMDDASGPDRVTEVSTDVTVRDQIAPRDGV